MLYLMKKVKTKGVTMTALLAKAAAMALVQHPVVNSSCKDGKSFTYNSSINIAVAVAINGGLITPVLQDADKVCYISNSLLLVLLTLLVLLLLYLSEGSTNTSGIVYVGAVGSLFVISEMERIGGEG